MRDVKRRIEKVELLVQCLGSPEVWFSPAHPLGFPGIAVPEPDVLQFCRAGVQGKTITVPDVGADADLDDRRAFENTCREQIRFLFEGAVGTAGPGDGRWSLGREVNATKKENEIYWLWGTQAVALALATRPLGPTGEVLPGATPEPYAVTYDVPSADGKHVTRIVARFNLLFHLVE
jgi:hypothetical protein